VFDKNLQDDTIGFRKMLVRSCEIDKTYEYLICSFTDKSDRRVSRALFKDEHINKTDQELLLMCGYYDYEIEDDLKTDDELEIKRNKFSVLITWKRKKHYNDPNDPSNWY